MRVRHSMYKPIDGYNRPQYLALMIKLYDYGYTSIAVIQGIFGWPNASALLILKTMIRAGWIKCNAGKNPVGYYLSADARALLENNDFV